MSAAFVSTTACIARGPEDYRTVTRQLVDTRRGDIESCFAGGEGKVVVDFTVEKKSGKITNPKVDSGKSTASAEAGECIAKAIEGLTLKEPDMRDGAARFTWTFGS
ncbi:hypothetical protein ACNOYE_01720 [Nannocystaceae bacterium ST9]